MIKRMLSHKNLDKNLNYFYLSLSFFGLLFLSFYGTNFEFYSLKWNYLTTPIGLIDSIFGSDLELNNWFSYLLVLSTSSKSTYLELFIVSILSITSLLYLLKRGNFKK